MRIFLAGASGLIGMRLLPLLIDRGHVVAGMTRSPEKAAPLREMGAEPVVCDVFDAGALSDAVIGFAPQAVMHQMTDLPDDVSRVGEFGERNRRIRTEGTRNLLAAAAAAGADRIYGQSIAFTPPGGGEAISEHERRLLEAGGLVIRYGQFYGPGTFYEQSPPDHPRIHVDAAAQATVELLDAPPGVVVVAEQG